jgi:hypothetical protein
MTVLVTIAVGCAGLSAISRVRAERSVFLAAALGWAALAVLAWRLG